MPNRIHKLFLAGFAAGLRSCGELGIECHSREIPARCKNMAAWRRNVNEISSAEEQVGDISPNEEEPFDENIPIAGYGNYSGQGEEGDQEDSDPDFSKLRKTDRAKKKKAGPGRKSHWKDEDVTHMVDIVCNSEYYKKKDSLHEFQKLKRQRRYSKLLKDIQERFEARGDDVVFTVEQVRNKLKKLISECKKVALTIKTATGVDRFQEKKNYGPWFPVLFALVKTRDSCQPERAVEPTCGSSEGVNEQSRASPASVEGSEESMDNGSSDDRKLFVPVKNRGKKRKKDVSSAVECMETVLERGPTKGVLEFYREKN